MSAHICRQRHHTNERVTESGYRRGQEEAAKMVETKKDVQELRRVPCRKCGTRRKFPEGDSEGTHRCRQEKATWGALCESKRETDTKERSRGRRLRNVGFANGESVSNTVSSCRNATRWWACQVRIQGARQRGVRDHESTLQAWT